MFRCSPAPVNRTPTLMPLKSHTRFISKDKHPNPIPSPGREKVQDEEVLREKDVSPARSPARNKHSHLVSLFVRVTTTTTINFARFDVFRHQTRPPHTLLNNRR